MNITKADRNHLPFVDVSTSKSLRIFTGVLVRILLSASLLPPAISTHHLLIDCVIYLFIMFLIYVPSTLLQKGRDLSVAFVL